MTRTCLKTLDRFRAATWNENPTPFVWHKTADQILERLADYCAAINGDTTA